MRVSLLDGETPAILKDCEWSVMPMEAVTAGIAKDSAIWSIVFAPSLGLLM